MEQPTNANQTWFRCPVIGCPMINKPFPNRQVLEKHMFSWHGSDKTSTPSGQPANPIALDSLHIPDNAPAKTYSHSASPAAAGFPQHIPRPLPSPAPEQNSSRFPAVPAPQYPTQEQSSSPFPPERERVWLEQSVKNFPKETEFRLKALMIKHKLSAYPKTDIDTRKKMHQIYAEFYVMVKFPNWHPKIDDALLWRLFTLKVDLIRADMIKNVEVRKTSEGYVLIAATDIRPKAPSTSTTRITVAAPVRSTRSSQCEEIYSAALETWKSFDAITQARLFRDQILNSRDAKSLVFEWEKYCQEETKKRVEEKQRAVVIEIDRQTALRKEMAKQEAAKIEAAEKEAAKGEAARKAVRRGKEIIVPGITVNLTHGVQDPAIVALENARHNDRAEVKCCQGLRQIEDDFENLDEMTQEKEMSRVKEWVMVRRKERGIDADMVSRRLTMTPPLTPVVKQRPFEKLQEPEAVSELNRTEKPESEVLEPKHELPEFKPGNLKAEIALKIQELKKKRESEAQEALERESKRLKTTE